MKHRQFEELTLRSLLPIALFPAGGGILAVIFFPSIAAMLAGICAGTLLGMLGAWRFAAELARLHQRAAKLLTAAPNEKQTESAASAISVIEAQLNRIEQNLDLIRSQAIGETALIEGERNKLRGVLNSMTDGVFALDRAGRIILFNHAASVLTGRRIESVAGQLAEKVMPFRRNGELVMTRWLAERPGQEKRVGEWRGLELYREDGSSLFVDVQAVVLKNDPNGIAALVTFHDLTKNHELEEMKTDFVSLAAHELRTPLTEVRGYLDIIAHEPLGLTGEGRKLLDRAAGSSARLSGLINNLLNVARIEHGELNLRQEALDWRAFLQSQADSLEERMTAQRRSLILDLPESLPRVHADRLGAEEIIANLVANAINHTCPDTGEITITARRRGREVETVIKDNGTGIPKRALHNIFNKFYRVEGLRSSPGTGLGLYICRAIAEAQGGHVWVESEEGKGSSFGFTLPIAPAIAEDSGSGDNTDKSNVTRRKHGWIKTRA